MELFVFSLNLEYDNQFAPITILTFMAHMIFVF
jgi:hypothetical protein